MMSEELIKIADSPVDETHDQERMIRERKWIMAKNLPRKYGKMAPMPAPPAIKPMPFIEDTKTIDVKPNDDPLNFARALRERRAIDGQHWSLGEPAWP